MDTQSTPDAATRLLWDIGKDNCQPLDSLFIERIVGSEDSHVFPDDSRSTGFECVTRVCCVGLVQEGGHRA